MSPTASMSSTVSMIILTVSVTQLFQWLSLLILQTRPRTETTTTLPLPATSTQTQPSIIIRMVHFVVKFVENLVEMLALWECMQKHVKKKI